MVLSSVLIFLAFVYLSLMFAYLLGWRTMPGRGMPVAFEPSIAVTVVIPARNEAHTILSCLESIVNASYPPSLLQIIVLDDFSEDDTVHKVRTFKSTKTIPVPNILLLQLRDYLPPESRFTANKKKSLALAVSMATGAIVITTDADCRVPPGWLRLIMAQFESDPNLAILTAPVALHREQTMLQYFQSLDLLGMMAITAGGMQWGWHVMGNGANLSYRKIAFETVGGYAGNEQIASGDDMFLIQKMAAKWPGCVGFLKHKDAVVYTEAAADWSAFWQQRLRWGTKNAALDGWAIRLALLAVWLFCSSIWLAAGLCLMGYVSWQVLAFQVFVKGMSDWLLLREVCSYFDRKELMHWFLPSFFIHTGYIALVGAASLFLKQYAWKGRRVKKG